MGVDFNKIFGASVRYPMKKDIFILFFAVQLVFAVAGWFVSAYLGADVVTAEGMFMPENMVPFLSYAVPLAILSWLAVTYLMPAYIDNAANFHRKKNKSIADSFDVSRKRFLSLLGLDAIFGLILLACFGGIILTVFATAIMESPEGMAMVAAGGLWVIAGIAAITVVGFMCCLSPVFCVLEKAKPLESMRKSWKLVGRNKATTLFFMVLFIVTYVTITLVGALPEMAYYMATGTEQAIGITADSFVFMLVRTLVGTYLVLFSVAAVTAYYLSVKKGGD